MNKEKIWLSSPHMSGREREFVKDVFDSNWIAPLGPHVDAFEQDLERYNNVKHVAALSNGTAAIHLSLIMEGVGPGDEVICQSMTFSASANPIKYQGATPVYIDSERDTWNMSPEFLKEAIEDRISKTGKKPKAIIPVHLYGMPAKMEGIMAVADEYEIAVIEDAAEALGSKYQDKFCGSFGKYGIYSFNGNKIITTSGGGALVSKDEGIIKKARYLATQARDPAPHYQHSEVGFNYRMSNVLAGIGRGQMEVLDERVNQRRANFKRYNEFFQKVNQKGFNIEFQQELEVSFSNRWLTCILINPERNNKMTREDIRLALEAENIESRPLWKPMHMQPVFEGVPFYGQGTSEKLFEQGLCLPSGSNLVNQDFERIFEALENIFNS